MKKYFIMSLAAFVLFTVLSHSDYVAAEDKSVGTAAGETARHMNDQAQKTAETATAEAEQTSKQMVESLQKLSVQFQTAMKSLEESSQDLMKQLGQEWEKFKQAYNKPSK